MTRAWTDEEKRRHGALMRQRHARRAWERARPTLPAPEYAPDRTAPDVVAPGLEEPAPASLLSEVERRALWEGDRVSHLIERFDPGTGELIARGHLVRRQAVPPEVAAPIWVTEWIDAASDGAPRGAEGGL